MISKFIICVLIETCAMRAMYVAAFVPYWNRYAPGITVVVRAVLYNEFEKAGLL